VRLDHLLSKDKAGLVSQTKQFVRDLCLFSFEGAILSKLFLIVL
jgi:hypothetical protein